MHTSTSLKYTRCKTSSTSHNHAIYSYCTDYN